MKALPLFGFYKSNHSEKPPSFPDLLDSTFRLYSAILRFEHFSEGIVFLDPEQRNTAAAALFANMAFYERDSNR